MAATPATDPRAPVEHVLPVVAAPRQGWPGWLVAVVIGIAALLLFALLEGRREAALAPAVKPRAIDESAAPPALPSLAIPPEPPPPAPVIVEAPPPLPAPRPTLAPPPVLRERPARPPPPPVTIASSPPLRPVRNGAGDSVLVVDNTIADGPTPAPTNGPQPTTGPGVYLTNSRAARASVLHNRATLVPQGTLIPAVLETAFDSTKAGLARALVSADVRGFDGAKVLIPRGSRLTGNYIADLQQGQKRALVTWTRLVRPDGVTVEIGSPAADPAGRIGVGGKVNNHFFARFGSAILQSALDVGVNLASRAGSGNSVAVVGLPGVQSSVQPFTNAQQIQPTLRVAAGTAITIFVARDLDFTGLEARP